MVRVPIPEPLVPLLDRANEWLSENCPDISEDEHNERLPEVMADIAELDRDAECLFL